MRCPSCSADETRVVDSRPVEAGAAIRRRRQCESCGSRFTTYERGASALVVRKRDGTTEAFESAKIRAGVSNAVADREVHGGGVDELVGAVERFAEEHGPEVGSEQLGRVVLKLLRELDEVSYLRFASVYKEFQGAQDFEREMASLDDAS